MPDAIIHISRTPGEYTEWQNTLDRWGRTGWNSRVYVSCCNRLEYPKNTQTRRFIPSGMSYYDPTDHFRCAPGKGCNANPGHKRTAHLRHYW